MPDLSVFDVVGPVMIGPSSSHTAGAVRLGQVARSLFGRQPKEVRMVLHGSFGTVYKGHHTDKALVAGLLGLNSDDENIKKSFAIAKKKKLKFEFQIKDLGLGFHPNTVRFYMKSGDDVMHVTGSSIGGGDIRIMNINGFDVNFTGDYSVLIIGHKNLWGQSLRIMQVFLDYKYDVVTMNTSKPDYKNNTITVIEMLQGIPEEIIPYIERIEGIQWVRVFNHPSHYSDK